ncbi:AAA family ATPase, partial [Chryseobacterium sp. HMWF001]
VEPINESNFIYYANKKYPSVGSQAPVISYKTNLEIQKQNKMKNQIDLLRYKKQIILQGPPGTGKTRLAKEISKKIIESNKISNATISVKTLTKNYIKSNLNVGQKIEGKNETIFEVVDLGKNVVLLKSDTSKPWRPSYNKIIDSFNNKLWKIKGRTGGFKSYEDAIAKYFYENHLNSINEEEQNLSNIKDFQKIIQFHPSYTYEDFVRGIVALPNEEGEGIVYGAENKTLANFAENASNDSDNNYVLIIDEINRANLSSVLGELIYALEYRGEEVESMYEVDGSQKLVLPPNLYIIGTMNTADRSVGHIDYAIRRRFAFVDVLPEKLEDTEDVFFNTPNFIEVAKLFIKTGEDEVINFENAEDSDFLSNDFSSKDVALGHSYFIADRKKISEEEKDNYFKMKMKYEIIPILNEYLRDGVFNESATAKIKDIEQRFA